MYSCPTGTSKFGYTLKTYTVQNCDVKNCDFSSSRSLEPKANLSATD